ncbi:MAG: MFS transporter [Euryarchaeota archaeon]|nr:MFS transporter [Euryarchaeota archaeon]MDE1835447.1 MFS transporter [Euryarchaeota archaeon]MDE1879583.1 MFS transporter [Euryarchaeota archaeon]MDE2046303.1 MFS transporter [Thermoplasmata archaeon]
MEGTREGPAGFVSPGEAALLEEDVQRSYKIPTPPLRRSSSDLWFLSYLPIALSDGLATPLIPLLAIAEYGLYHNAFFVTAIIAASTIFEVPCMILWGNLSDRVRHRKWFLVASFAATGSLLILMAFPMSIGDYFLLNLAEGVASAAAAPIGTVLLLETRNKRWWSRDLGLFGLISGVGAVLGLALGSVWFLVSTPHTLATSFSSSAAQNGMRWLLGTSGVLALGGAATALAWVEEPHALLSRAKLAEMGIRDRGVIERFRRTRRRVLHIVDLTKGVPGTLPRGETAFLAALLVMSIGFQVFYGPLPVFLTSDHASHGAQLAQSGIFLVYLASAGFATGLFYHSGLAVEYGNPKKVFLLSLAVRALIIPCFFFVPVFLGGSYYGLRIALILLNGAMGVSWAFLSTASTLFLLRLVHGRSRGKALGWYNALAGLGGLAGTLWGGILYDAVGAEDTFFAAALIVVIGMLMLVPIRFHQSPYEPRPPVPSRRRSKRSSAA